MPRYVASVALTGDSAGASAALDAVADSAEESAGKMESAFSEANAKVTEGFDDMAGKVGAAGDEGFGAVADSSELMGAKVSAVLDAMAAEVTETATVISARLDEAFAKSALAAQEMATKADASIATVGASAEDAGDKAGGHLAKGVVAVAAGIAYESLKVADAFDTAQVGAETAVKAIGDSWSKVKVSFGAAETGGVAKGFTSTETVAALGELTTATQSPTKALKDLSVAQDLARKENISLADATSLMTKMLAGNTKGLATLGINIDIGSGKLASIRTATEAAAAATVTLKDAQEAAYMTGLVGNHAQDFAQQQALNAVTAAKVASGIAAANLARDKNAPSLAMSTLNEKTGGASSLFDATSAGQAKIFDANLNQLGKTIGGVLDPAVDDAKHAFEDLTGMLSRDKPVVIGLGIAVGVVLAAALAVVAERGVSKAVKAFGGFRDDLGKVRTGITETIGKIRGIGASTEETAPVVSASAGEMETSIGTLPAAAEEAEVGVTAGMEGAEASTEAAAVGMDAAVGSTGVGLILIGLGLAAMELEKHWRGAWTGVKAVVSEAANLIEDVLKNHIVRDILWVTDPLLELALHWREVWGDIRKVAEDAWHFLDGLYHDFESAGKNLVQGVVRGLEDGAKDVLKDAEDIGHHVLHALTHPWEILSPSKATARAGAQLVQGISVGIKAEQTGLLASVDEVARSVNTRLIAGLTKDIAGDSHFVAAAVATMMAKTTASTALKDVFSAAMGGSAHPTGPGSSVSTNFNMNNTVIQAQNPDDMARQLALRAKRKSLVRT